VNDGGGLGELDFRFPIGAPVSGLQAFARTKQLGNSDEAANALRLGTSPIVRALVDFDGGMDMVRVRAAGTACSSPRLRAAPTPLARCYHHSFPTNRPTTSPAGPTGARP